MQNRRGQITLLKKSERWFRGLAKKKYRAVSLILLAAVPIFVLFVGSRILKGRDAADTVIADNAAIQQEIDKLKAENDNYRAVLSNDDPEVFRDYVIRTARDRLDLSLPGDQVFKDRAQFKSGQ